MRGFFHSAMAAVALMAAPSLVRACSCLDTVGICQKPPDPGNPDRAVFVGVVREVYPKSHEEMNQIHEEFRRLHPELANRAQNANARRSAGDAAENVAFRKEFIKFLWRGSLSDRELEQLQGADWRGLDRLMLDYRQRVRIEVVENFTGADRAEFEAYTALDGPACGFSFTEGETYLVDASRAPAGGNWQVSVCSRTEALAKAAEDLQWLRAWKNGVRLAGRIQGLGEPGARIRLLGGAQPLETTADNSGLFEFDNLDRHFYEVETAGETDRRPVDLVAAGCAQVFLPRKP